MLSARCSPVALLITCRTILAGFFFFPPFFPALFLGIDSFFPSSCSTGKWVERQTRYRQSQVATIILCHVENKRLRCMLQASYGAYGVVPLHLHSPYRLHLQEIHDAVGSAVCSRQHWTQHIHRSTVRYEETPR